MHARTSHGPTAETEAVRRVREARIAASLLKSPVRYHCSICTGTFAQKKGLYRHLRDVHDAEAEITAAKSNFGREAAKRRQGMKKKTKVVFYSPRCRICSQTFSQRQNLYRHLRTMHGGGSNDAPQKEEAAEEIDNELILLEMAKDAATKLEIDFSIKYPSEFTSFVDWDTPDHELLEKEDKIDFVDESLVDWGTTPDCDLLEEN